MNASGVSVRRLCDSRDVQSPSAAADCGARTAAGCSVRSAFSSAISVRGLSRSSSGADMDARRSAEAAAGGGAGWTRAATRWCAAGIAGCARAVACRSLARRVRGSAAACATTGCSALAVIGAASAVITGLAAAASGAAWTEGSVAGTRAAASAGSGGWAMRLMAVTPVCVFPGARAGSKAGSCAAMSQPMMPSAPRVQQDASTARRAGAAASGCERGRTTTGSGFTLLDGVQWQARCGASTSIHVVSVRAVYVLPDRAADVPRNVHSRPSGMPSSGRNRGTARSPSTGTNGDGFMAAIRGAARAWSGCGAGVEVNSKL